MAVSEIPVIVLTQELVVRLLNSYVSVHITISFTHSILVGTSLDYLRMSLNWVKVNYCCRWGPIYDEPVNSLSYALKVHAFNTASSPTGRIS